MDAQQTLRTEVEQLVRVHGRGRTALMPILQDLNRAHSYISEDAMLAVSAALPPSSMESRLKATSCAGATSRRSKSLATAQRFLSYLQENKLRIEAARPVDVQAFLTQQLDRHQERHGHRSSIGRRHIDDTVTTSPAQYPIRSQASAVCVSDGGRVRQKFRSQNGGYHDRT